MIPYLAFWVMISLAGMFADLLIEREILTIKWTRKLFCAIGIKVSYPLGFISYFYSANHVMLVFKHNKNDLKFCCFVQLFIAKKDIILNKTPSLAILF